MQLAVLFKVINVNNHNSFFMTMILALGILCFSGPVNAGQWKPLCVEGSSCSSLYQVHLGGGFGFVSDVNATQLPDGRKLAFWLGRVAAWYEPEDGIEITNWSGKSTVGLNNAALTGPPIV